MKSKHDLWQRSWVLCIFQVAKASSSSFYLLHHENKLRVFTLEMDLVIQKKQAQISKAETGPLDFSANCYSCFYFLVVSVIFCLNIKNREVFCYPLFLNGDAGKTNLRSLCMWERACSLDHWRTKAVVSGGEYETKWLWIRSLLWVTSDQLDFPLSFFGSGL